MEITITLNVKGFQDSIEIRKSGNEIKFWHVYNGKDVLINRFDSLSTTIEDIHIIALEYIDLFYGQDKYEIINTN